MSFDEGNLISPSVVNAAYCSDECHRQCSPESCPGLTSQCTDRCVVVVCLDSHDDDDNQEVCGDIICDDQSCTDPTDCHGIYEFVSLSSFSSFQCIPLDCFWVQIHPMCLNNFPGFSLKIVVPDRRSLLVPPRCDHPLATVLRRLPRLPLRTQARHVGSS